MRALRLLLFPFSFLYGLVVWLRNLMFDLGVLASKKGKLPTIVIGNLNTGGTGKTPHTIALANLLSEFQPAILSRGYGRKTHGFIELTQAHSANDVGDEPLLYLKHTNSRVAVCEDRVQGIEFLAKAGKNTCVLLDDAYQHRKLKGDHNILIIAQAKPIWKDYYLPSGDLRDHKNQVKRANSIIISGCSSQSMFERSISNLSLRADQKAYWSYTKQLPLRNWGTHETPELIDSQEIVVVTGIAKAKRLLKYLEEKYTIVKHFRYNDHHYYTESEVEQWLRYLVQHPEAILVTTEKDAVRMNGISQLKAETLFVAPIEIEIQGVAELVNDLKSSIRSVK